MSLTDIINRDINKEFGQLNLTTFLYRLTIAGNTILYTYLPTSKRWYDKFEIVNYEENNKCHLHRETINYLGPLDKQNNSNIRVVNLLVDILKGETGCDWQFFSSRIFFCLKSINTYCQKKITRSKRHGSPFPTVRKSGGSRVILRTL